MNSHKKRILELAGVTMGTSDVMAPTAFQSYGHINKNEDTLNYKIKITTPDKVVANEVWKQIKLYQLGEDVQIKENKKDGTFDVELFPSVERGRVLDIIDSLFGNVVFVEIIEEG